MTISRDTFDPAKRYAQLFFQEDRDLLDSELNELQAIVRHEQRQVFDALLAPGMIIAGCDATLVEATVTLAAGTVYLDGRAEPVPAAVLNFDPEKTSGIDHVWVAVLRRVVDVTLDPTLVNPLTGEPTAEREQWVVTVHASDPSGEPLPPNALGRTVAALYDFDRATGLLTPSAARPPRPDDGARLDAHLDHGGAVHPAATPDMAGFLTAVDKTKLDGIASGATVSHRTATLVIAASDTSAAGKAAADAVCSGQYTVDPRTGDQDTINAALTAVAALPAGGTVLLLEGSYQISDPILLRDHTRLVGVGGGSRLQVPAGYAVLGTFAVIQNADRTNGNSDIAVLDLTIDGGNDGGDSEKIHGIDWWGPVHGHIMRVDIRQLDGHGIKLGGDSGAPICFTAIRATTVDTCRGFGIWITGTGWMNTLTDCLLLRNAGNAGLRLSGVSDTLVTNNRIYFNEQHGLELAGACSYLTVAHNILAHNGIAADDTYSNLRVTLADHCLIQGNRCRRYLMGSDLDQTKYGLHIVAGQHNFVTGNHLYEAGKTDDLLDDGTATHLHANVTSSGLEAP